MTLRVEPSQGFVHGSAPHKEVWLLIEWPESETEPTKYFLGDLPASYKLRRLVRLAKCRWKVEQGYQQLNQELGLDHYEGRSWTGSYQPLRQKLKRSTCHVGRSTFSYLPIVLCIETF